MVGGFFATNIGSMTPFGMEGWRFAFHLMAAVSLLTSGLVFYVATDPRPTAKVMPHVQQSICPVTVNSVCAVSNADLHAHVFLVLAA